MLAVVNAQTGTVIDSPLPGGGAQLHVNMDILGEHEIDFHKQSSLLVLRNACADARSECGVYYFNLRNDKFTQVHRTLVDLMEYPPK